MNRAHIDHCAALCEFHQAEAVRHAERGDSFRAELEPESAAVWSENAFEHIADCEVGE
jgi:hypothetical protein